MNNLPADWDDEEAEEGPPPEMTAEAIHDRRMVVVIGLIAIAMMVLMLIAFLAIAAITG